MTYTEFTADSTRVYWSCDAGLDDNGNPLADVLVYETEDDMAADDDNSLAVARATVIDDR
jgi:hypothetical protein